MFKIKVIGIGISVLLSLTLFAKSQDSQVVNKDSLLYLADSTNKGDTVHMDSEYKHDSVSINEIVEVDSFQIKREPGFGYDSTQVVYGWTLDENYVMPIKHPIDTDIVRFNVYNNVVKKYWSLAYLGNFGSAYLPLSFLDQNPYEDVLFLNSYKEYFNLYENTVYLNTKKPYTELYYVSGGPTRDKLEFFKVSHSQNINEKINLGVNFFVNSNKGQYRYLQTNTKSFKAYGSYSGKNYLLHSTFNYNKYVAHENGGINDSVYWVEDEFDPKDYPTNYTGGTSPNFNSDVRNRIRYIDGMVSQRLKLFSIGASDSTKKSSSIAEPYLSHVFIGRRTSKMFSSDLQDTGHTYFENYYFNPVETFDSVAQVSLSNKIQLDFKTKIKNKVTAGIYASINHEYQRYTYYTLLDSSIVLDSLNTVNYDSATNTYYYGTGDEVYRYNLVGSNDSVDAKLREFNTSNIFISGGIYGKFWNRFQSHFSANLYLAGNKIGQSGIQGKIITKANILSNPYLLTLNGKIENIAYPFYIRKYYSNNYIWENDGSNSFINKVVLSGKISAPSNKFELSGDYYLIRNHIFQTDSVPLINEGIGISYLALGVEKEFTIWKFHSYNKVLFQLSGDTKVINVPPVILSNSTYFDHTWNFKRTGGKLRTMVGFDIYYNSTFNGLKYNPAFSVFYPVDEQMGNYPFMDFWINVKLKTVRFFIKAEHLNSMELIRQSRADDYKDYRAISYPANRIVLKTGISWTFYN